MLSFSYFACEYFWIVQFWGRKFFSSGSTSLSLECEYLTVETEKCFLKPAAKVEIAKLQLENLRESFIGLTICNCKSDLVFTPPICQEKNVQSNECFKKIENSTTRGKIAYLSSHIDKIF